MTDRTTRRRRWLSGAALGGLAALGAGCGNDNHQNTLDPKGPAAQKIMDLFTPFFWVAVVIGVGVIGTVVLFAVKFRYRAGKNDNPVQVHGNTRLEIGWTIAPALILFVMAVPTIGTIVDLSHKPKGDGVEITVTGKQWWWQYEYKQEAIVTANEMHIPVGRPVYLRLQSDNVIHSFWVPNLAGKKDVVPGRTNTLTIEADTPGVYLGQCAEYCGLSHANMRLRVSAQTEADYEAWVAGQQRILTGADVEFVTRPADKGGLIQKYGCTGCHSFNGVEGATARVGPNLTHVAGRTTFAGAIYDLNRENLRKWVYDAPSRKPNEYKRGVGMPSFKEQGITPEEVDKIVDYLLTLT